MWRYICIFLSTLPLVVLSSHEQLCSLPPESYGPAKQQYPDIAYALEEVEKQGIASWYTDRSTSWPDLPSKLLSYCPSSSRLNIVVYGLPKKDCEARESQGGTNHNHAEYQAFINHLQQTIGDRKVLYVLEPDAVALLAAGGCAKTLGYEENLKYAIRTLSINPNADIYVDVGYWMLMNDRQLNSISSIIQDLYQIASFKGITINTSNYRSNMELSHLCHNFRKLPGNEKIHCTIDTSRNFNGPSSLNEWCNYKNAGIGVLPTDTIEDDNIDYYIWIKVPGESDGQCTDSGRTSDAMKGPEAGKFSIEYFKLLWNHGVFVKEKGMPMIDGTIHVVTTPTPSPEPTASSAPYSAPPSIEPTPSSAAYTATPVTTSRVSNREGSQGSYQNANESEREIRSGIVTAPELTTAVPISQNLPTTQPVHVAQTQSQHGSIISSGVVVLVCLIAVALVALSVVVVFQRRQRHLENKTPRDSDLHQLSTSPSDIFVL